MLELATTVSPVAMTDRIDELSTRLILDGAASLGSIDFEKLAGLAVELGNSGAEIVAVRIAERIAAEPALCGPDLTRIVSSGLVELRCLLDEPAVSSQTMSPADQAISSEEPHPKAPENRSLADDEELIREFITESSEHLMSIESQLLILETDNSATETLNAIFRGFHTIKGLAGFLEFAEIRSLTHEIETLLDLARTSQLTVTPSLVDVALESTDVVRDELAAIADKLAGRTPPPSRVNPALLDRVRKAALGTTSSLEPNSTPSIQVELAQTPSSPSLVLLEAAGELPRAEEDGTAERRGQERRSGDAPLTRLLDAR